MIEEDEDKPQSPLAFAKLLEAVILMEREACAKLADSMDPLQDGAIGNAIRARSNP